MRIKYLVKRVFNLNYGNMFKIAKKISKKTNKKSITIVFDMIKCGIKYQAGYYDYQEFEFYLLNANQRKTYLTRGKNDAIVKKYNKKDYWYKFDDKAIFNKNFKEFVKRKHIDLRNCSKLEFEDFMTGIEYIIAKPINGDGGKGIEIFESFEPDLYHRLITNKQYLVEEVIKQHEKLNELYNKSVNTLRIFTFLKDGVPYVLQSILKIGNGGVIDNFSSGGMYTFLDENGKVIVPAIDQQDNIYETHPISNKKIIGFEVPMFQEAIEMVKEAAKVVPEIAYVGWDVAITDKGPVVIEGNCYPGVFQIKPSFSNDKIGILPKYESIMK